LKPTARSILFSIGLGTAITVLTVVGVGLWFVLGHRHSVAASPQLAEAEFAELRARFANQLPLVDMNQPQAQDMPGIPPATTPPRFVHTVIFDTRGGQRIVRMTVPYWLARRFAGRTGEFKWLGQLTFLDDTEFDPEAIHLSLDQLERRGPGLIAYYRHPGGGQFISWVE